MVGLEDLIVFGMKKQRYCGIFDEEIKGKTSVIIPMEPCVMRGLVITTSQPALL